MRKTASDPPVPQPGEGKRGEQGYLGLSAAAGERGGAHPHGARLVGGGRDAAAVRGADNGQGLSRTVERPISRGCRCSRRRP